MRKQIEDFKWQKNGNLLLKDVVSIVGTYGNCNVVRLSNGRYAILDRSKLRFLVPTDSSYNLSLYWAMWFEKGFVLFSKLSDHRYYILNARTMEPVTRKTIINLEASSFLDGKSNYFVIVSENYQRAIFNSEGKQISDWYDWIDLYGLVRGQSDYYLVKKEDKQAIFHKNGRRISDWFDQIDISGLVFGQSDYYLVVNERKEAIFHKDGKQISNWFDSISVSGLVEGSSDYYIVKKDDKYSICHKSGEQISDWFFMIEPYGLVAGWSDYYIAEKCFNGVCKQAVFDKDRNQITDWHNLINIRGLITGQSPYCITIEEKGKKSIVYIYKAGSKKVLGPFKDVKILDEQNNRIGFIDDPSKDRIVVVMLNGRIKEITKEEADKFFDQEEMMEREKI
jgi:hypothetical protein